MSSKRTILVGVFIVGGGLLFAAGLFLIGTRKQVFAHHYDIYTDFDKIDTLTAGSKVRVSGMDAGEVSDIDVPRNPASHFRLKLHVDEKFRPIIRQDSVTSIETEGMVGNKYVDIAKGGANSPECPPGGTLPSRAPVELGDLMRQGAGIATSAQKTIDDLRKHSDTAIQHVTTLVEHVDSTVEQSRGDVKAITSNGAKISENANQMVRDIQEGQGAAGKLLADKTVASNVSATIADAKDASASAKAASANVEQASEQVKAITAQLDQATTKFLKTNDKNQNTAEVLRDTVQEADRAVDNVKEDTEALKHNFFLRGFFNRRGFYNLTDLTPNKYAKTEFVKKPRLRVWVPAAGVFTPDSDGKQELKQDGRAILDQDMSEILRYLPNNPIMVEGYAAAGTPEQRYTASRQRALDVREYLESNFHIDPKYIGAIPLEDHPPNGTGRETWDGVCLVLVVSK